MVALEKKFIMEYMIYRVVQGVRLVFCGVILSAIFRKERYIGRCVTKMTLFGYTAQTIVNGNKDRDINYC